jgi:hypothetical protein
MVLDTPWTMEPRFPYESTSPLCRYQPELQPQQQLPQRFVPVIGDGEIIVEVTSAVSAAGLRRQVPDDGRLDLRVHAPAGRELAVFVDGTQAMLRTGTTHVTSADEPLALELADPLPAGTSLISVVAWTASPWETGGATFLAVRRDLGWATDLPVAVESSTEGQRMLLEVDTGVPLPATVDATDGEVWIRPCTGEAGFMEDSCAPQDYLVVAVARGEQVPILRKGPAARFVTSLGAITELNLALQAPASGSEVVVLQLPGYHHTLADEDGTSAWAQAPAEVGRFTVR